MADTPENVACFGRHTTARGSSAFPQAQVVYLSECCTHKVVDDGLWPLHTSERFGGLRLLRSVVPGMLVLIDIVFFSYEMADRIVHARGAQVLARVGGHMTLKPIAYLKDSSYTAIR